MKLSDLENVKQGTVLVSEGGIEREFVCCYKGLVVANRDATSSIGWKESEIKNWTIKQGPRKLFAYSQGALVAFFTIGKANSVCLERTNGKWQREPEYDIEYKE